MGDDEIVTKDPCYVPEELVTHILCYLPVKSLIRFRGVCKYWVCLIKNDHDFAIKHYVTRATSSSKLMDTVDCMFNMAFGGELRRYSISKSKTFRLLKEFEWLPRGALPVVNSCHGIIYFRTSYEILLCNPSIREVVVLKPVSRRESREGTGFGFDPLKNDYKVVLIEFHSKPVLEYFRVKLYSVRHGQWRGLPVSACLKDISRLEGYAVTNGNGRMCNWIGQKTIYESGEKQPMKRVLVSFDMVDEVSREFPLPICIDSEICHSHELVSSSLWQACVCCIHWRPSSCVDVWVLEDWKWSKKVSVKFPDEEVVVQPLSFWINDKELLVRVVEVKAGANEKQKGEVLRYNIGTKQFSRTRLNYSWWWYSKGYVESLVSMKRLMPPSSYEHGEYKQWSNKKKQASKQHKKTENGEYVFREVGRKGVNWSCTFKLDH